MRWCWCIRKTTSILFSLNETSNYLLHNKKLCFWWLYICLAEMTKHESRDNFWRSLVWGICGECSCVVERLWRTYTFQRQGLERKLNFRAWTVDTQFRWLHAQAVGGSQKIWSASLTFPFILRYSHAPAQVNSLPLSISKSLNCSASFRFQEARVRLVSHYFLPSLAKEYGS
jgi:hypothetical protein